MSHSRASRDKRISPSPLEKPEAEFVEVGWD